MKIFKLKKVNNFLPQFYIHFLGIKLTIKQKQVKSAGRKQWQSMINQLIGKNVTLIFDHALGGGTQTFFFNHIQDIHTPILRIQCHPRYHSVKISLYSEGTRLISLFDNNIKNIFSQLQELNYEEIIINSLVGYQKLAEFQQEIQNLQSVKKSKLTYMVHDYFFLCPNITLTDSLTHQFCNNTFLLDKCKNCAPKALFIPAKEKNNFNIFEWQNTWREFLREASEIRTFCNAAKNITASVFPEYIDKMTVVPHVIKPFQKDKFNIGVIGNIGIDKGRNIIEDFVKYLATNQIVDIQLYLIGEISPAIENPYLVVHGKYSREELPELLEKYNINIVFIPSIWAETFSYTTAEAIALNYPVMCFDLGGQAEQVKKYAKGIIVSPNPENIFNSIENYRKGVINAK